MAPTAYCCSASHSAVPRPPGLPPPGYYRGGQSLLPWGSAWCAAPAPENDDEQLSEEAANVVMYFARTVMARLPETRCRVAVTKGLFSRLGPWKEQGWKIHVGGPLRLTWNMNVFLSVYVSARAATAARLHSLGGLSSSLGVSQPLPPAPRCSCDR